MTTDGDAFEAAIVEAPDDAGAYLVYADWLQLADDPLGPLIVMQVQGRERDAAQWIAAHERELLGPLAGFSDVSAQAVHRRRLELGWGLGGVASIDIGWATSGDPARAVADWRAFLALPATRFVRHIKLGSVPQAGDRGYVPFVDAVIAQRPPLLRSLFAGDHSQCRLARTPAAAAAPVLAAFPALRHLTIVGLAPRIGAIDHPGLRAFAVHTHALPGPALADLCTAQWPQLERLDVWFGDPGCGAAGNLNTIAPLLDARTLPRLEHLGLRNCAFADDLAAALPRARVLGQLASLDLSLGALSDAGARAIAAARRAYGHLQRLDVSNNALTRAARPLLAGIARDVVLGEFHDPTRADQPDPRQRRVAFGG